MPRVPLTRTTRLILYGLLVYVVVMLGLILVTFIKDVFP